jgi:hypothetical protein
VAACSEHSWPDFAPSCSFLLSKAFRLEPDDGTGGGLS